MKKLPLIISLIALLGVLVLFVLQFTGNSEPGQDKPVYNTETGTTSSIKVAYLNTDSVLVNYLLAQDLNAEFVDRQKQYNDEFAKKQANFEKDAVAFQEKLQRGGFLTEQRAVSERDRILAEEQEIKQLDYELSNKLGELEQKINLQLVDSIVNYVKVFNEKNNYNYIFSNNGNIVIGDPKHNITREIVVGLNKRYDAAMK